MHGFRERLKAGIALSPVYSDNIWKLSTDAGLGQRTVYNITRDEKFDSSPTGPGFFAIARIANLLGVSLDYLAGSTPPIRHRTPNKRTRSNASEFPTAEMDATKIMTIWAKSGGRIEAFGPIIEFADQYEPLEEGGRLTVRKLGNDSLAAVSMGTTAIEALQSAIDQMEGDSLHGNWSNDYCMAKRRGVLTTVESLDVQMPNRPQRIKLDYIRILLFVKDAAGVETILNFSLRIL